MIREWASQAEQQLAAAFAALDAPREWDAEAAQDLAIVMAERDRLAATVRGLAEAGQRAMLTRIHGDLHLGQVLVANGDVYIIDFEGEPAKPVALRRAKNHRLRDVAGMLRSFDYAGAVMKRRSVATQAHVADPQRDAFLRTFVVGAVQSFLAGYADVLPAEDAEAEQNLLRLFLIEKAAYEIAYEAANRPAWIDVPLHGLAQLIAQEPVMNDVAELSGLPSGVAEALAAGTWRDPFAVLGPLDTAVGRVVRVFLPGALQVEVLARASGETLGRLAPIAPPGLFAGQVSGTEPYLLRITWPDAVQETEDPYSFGPLLGDLDLHLFNEGRHFELASHLGANVVTIDGVTGVRFAVWAPNARAVSVVGDFNTWDPRRNLMRLRFPAGVWELFVPRLPPGARYKFAIVGPDGARLPLKADPLARATEPPPATASVVADPLPHVWHDETWMQPARSSPCHRCADLDL